MYGIKQIFPQKKNKSAADIHTCFCAELVKQQTSIFFANITKSCTVRRLLKRKQEKKVTCYWTVIAV